MREERRPQVVIVNSTPIITLAIVDQLTLLRDLYGAVMVPSAVYREVKAGGPNRAGAQQLEAAPWIRTERLADPRRADLLSDLDRGEAEVIALAQEQDADLVVIDERLGRRHAKRLGLALTGTLGILLRAKQKGLLSGLSPVIQTIQQEGTRLGDALVEEVLTIAGEFKDPTA